MEGRIATLENMLKTAKIIDDEDINTDAVSVGSTVKVLDKEFGDELEITIVGSAEADPAEMKISNEAPIGSGLMGAKVGDVVEIQIPDGSITYEVLGIRRR